MRKDTGRDTLIPIKSNSITPIDTHSLISNQQSFSASLLCIETHFLHWLGLPIDAISERF